MAQLVYHPERCIGCAGCEVVCNLQRDGSLSTMGSSIMFHVEDERGYYGIIVKRGDGTLLLGKPEGSEVKRPSEISGGSASSKPIVMRPPCDMCGGKPRCVAFCPAKAISEGEG